MPDKNTHIGRRSYIGLVLMKPARKKIDYGGGRFKQFRVYNWRKIKSIGQSQVKRHGYDGKNLRE